MTEETIIDGVNVAECEFCKPNPLYKIEYACHCRGYIQDDGLHVHLSCEHNPNCYYKQLKLLEQENKALKDNNNHLQAIINDGRAENKRFREENKELKEEIQFHNKENSNLLAERNAAQIGCDEIREVRERYRSALEEINILAKNYCNACDEFKAKTYKNKNDCLYCNYGFIKRKINEVLNEVDR